MGNDGEDGKIIRLYQPATPDDDAQKMGEYLQSRLDYIQRLRDQIPDILRLCNVISNGEFEPMEEVVFRLLMMYPVTAVVKELEVQALHYKSMMDVDDDYDWMDDTEKALDKVSEASKDDVPF